MRHMFVVIDNSACMTEKDLKPSRYYCVLKVNDTFHLCLNSRLKINYI